MAAGLAARKFSPKPAAGPAFTGVALCGWMGRAANPREASMTRSQFFQNTARVLGWPGFAAAAVAATVMAVLSGGCSSSPSQSGDGGDAGPAADAAPSRASQVV